MAISVVTIRGVNATGPSTCSTTKMDAYWLRVLAAAVNSRYVGQRRIDVEELWPTDDAVARRYEECAPMRAAGVERKRMAL